MTSEPSSRRSWAAAIALSSVGLAWTLSQPAWSGLHFEESPNAALAILSRWTGLTDTPTLAYRAFCGGCIATGLAARAPFSVLPETVGTWRLLSVGWHLAWTAVTLVAATRMAGPRALVPAGLLMACLPPAATWLGMRLWGNHLEASIAGAALVVAASRYRRRGAHAAIALGLGVAWWGSWSALPFVLVGLAVIARARRSSALFAVPLAGLTAGAGWAWQRAVDVRDPWVVLRGEVAQRDLPRPALDKAAELLTAEPWLTAFGVRADPTGLLGVAVAVTLLALGVRLARAGLGPARALVAIVVLWTAIYLASPLSLGPFEPGLATEPLYVRYAAPLLVLAPAIGAAGLATLPRSAAWALCAVLMLPGAVDRVVKATWPAVHHLAVPAVDGAYVRATVLQNRGLRPDRWTCDADPRCPAWRATTRGIQDLQRSVYGGGPALDGLTPPDGPDRLPWLEGAAGAQLRLDTTGAPTDRIAALDDVLRIHLPDDADRAAILADAAAIAGVFARPDPATPATPRTVALAWSHGVRAGRADTPQWDPPDAAPPLRDAWTHGYAAARLATHGDAPADAPPPGPDVDAARAWVAAGAPGAPVDAPFLDPLRSPPR